ncbi:transcription intermediary factor 1-beta-like, partial [Mercenaria mercenaria]|uniref:transcription intermediary factor 1-beta-like n=1 Tax=Mercenaria mercenaria TaxID=6596 RepID=UPI00234E6C77
MAFSKQCESDEVHEMHCEQCEEFGENAVAEGFCKDCLEYMCKSCLKYHARQNRKHKLQDSNAMPQDFCFERCSVHPNKFIRFYCAICETFACTECRTTVHNTCTDIGHVPTMAREVESSEELKELLKEIGFITKELENTKSELNTSVDKVHSQGTQTKVALEKRKEQRKVRLKDQKQNLVAYFDRYLKEVTTRLKQESQEKIAYLTKEQNKFEKEQTENEREMSESLEKTTKGNILKLQSLLAKGVAIYDNMKTIVFDLDQQQKIGQRCKLFMTLKSSMKVMKREKLKINKYLKDTSKPFEQNLPTQTMENASKCELPFMLRATAFPGNLEDKIENTEEMKRMRDLLRERRYLLLDTKDDVYVDIIKKNILSETFGIAPVTIFGSAFKGDDSQ